MKHSKHYRKIKTKLLFMVDKKLGKEAHTQKRKKKQQSHVLLKVNFTNKCLLQ